MMCLNDMFVYVVTWVLCCARINALDDLCCDWKSGKKITLNKLKILTLWDKFYDHSLGHFNQSNQYFIFNSTAPQFQLMIEVICLKLNYNQQINKLITSSHRITSFSIQKLNMCKHLLKISDNNSCYHCHSIHFDVDFTWYFSNYLNTYIAGLLMCF